MNRFTGFEIAGGIARIGQKIRKWCIIKKNSIGKFDQAISHESIGREIWKFFALWD